MATQEAQPTETHTSSFAEHEALHMLIKAVTDYQWDRGEVPELRPAWEAAIKVWARAENEA